MIRVRMGKPDKDMKAWAIAQGRKAKQEMDRILEEVLDEAVEDMIAIIEAAITDTGEARAAAGGNGPGRVDTGRMRDAVKRRLLEKTPERTVGAWGWLDEVAEYFIYQEVGSEKFNVHFKGMSALQGSFLKARENFQRKLAQVGKVV